MVSPDFSILGRPQNALSMFSMGAEIGQQARTRQREGETRNALAVVLGGQSPQPHSTPGIGDGQRGPDITDDSQAWGTLLRNDPRLAMQLQQQRGQQARQQQEQKRADLPLLGRLLDGSTDETSYQRNRQIAQQYGIDVSQLPPNFDPAWVAQQRDTIKLLSDPKAQEALSTAGKIAADMGLRPGTPEFNAKVTEIWRADQIKTIPFTQGGGVAGYNAATGETTSIIQPNPGGYAAGAPVGGGAPQAGPKPGAVVNGFRFRGGNPNDRASWEAVAQGGPTPQASGTFRAGFSGLPGETVTSTFRNPAKNKSVGGVVNSYHMRRGADGNALARDSVPPPGMSMAAYAAELRRLNPDKEVINEGDHVHMEPR